MEYLNDFFFSQDFFAISGKRAKSEPRLQLFVVSAGGDGFARGGDDCASPARAGNCGKVPGGPPACELRFRRGLVFGDDEADREPPI